ncbi:MAG: ParB/RepB/Spo0J family partition protein [Fuerstiella sp.]
MKKAEWLETQLGDNMAESAGHVLGGDDRFDGFVPADLASGEMALDHIMEDDEQPRKTFDEAALQEFADHLKRHGVQQPIQLRWSEPHSKWKIVYGHRRFRAATLAGFETIPCVFADDGMDETTLRIRQLVENCQREDLRAMEMARGIDALAEVTGWSNRNIAAELGMNHTTIGRYRDLLKLPEDLQDRVNQGELAPSVAVSVLALKTATARSQMGNHIADQKLNRRAATDRIQAALAGKSSIRPDLPSSRPSEILHQSETLLIYRSAGLSDTELKAELERVVRKLETELCL